MKAYAEAKGRIFKQDTVRVVNREDAETLRLAQGGPVRTFGGGEPVKAANTASPEGLTACCGFPGLMRARLSPRSSALKSRFSLPAATTR